MLKTEMSTPYYAVIFTSIRTDVDEGYAAMAQRMEALAKEQPSFLGVESARDTIGITVSYWKDLESIQRWKAHAEHQVAQALGKSKWYESYRVRICRVEKAYQF